MQCYLSGLRICVFRRGEKKTLCFNPFLCSDLYLYGIIMHNSLVTNVPFILFFLYILHIFIILQVKLISILVYKLLLEGII